MRRHNRAIKAWRVGRGRRLGEGEVIGHGDIGADGRPVQKIRRGFDDVLVGGEGCYNIELGTAVLQKPGRYHTQFGHSNNGDFTRTWR